MACTGLSYGDGFVAGSLGFVDCQAQAIASLGYQALATPGSAVSLLLTGLLTLFVALFGYRMMLGEVPTVRDGVVSVAKIGLVLALATSWATYRTLAFDVVLRAPAELVAAVGSAADLPGARGDLVERLQLVDAGLVRLGELGIGKRETGEQVTRFRNINGRSEAVIESAQAPVSITEPVALALARLFYLTSSVGALAIVTFVAAILLALGPLFIGFLLFDTTRGWFVGWLRGLSATMIGAFGIAILLGVELALVEPWLTELITRRLADQTIAGAPVELLAATTIFTLAVVALLAAAARVAGGLRFPDRWRAAPAPLAPSVELGARSQTSTTVGIAALGDPRPRAMAVADAVVAAQRREAAGTTAVAGPDGMSGPRAPAAQTLARDLPAARAVPLGQSLGRRSRNRVSASAGRRDSRA